MAELLIIIFIAVVYVTEIPGIIKLSKSEKAIFESYEFPKIKELKEESAESLLDADTAVIGSDTKDEETLQVLGDLDKFDDINLKDL